MLPKQETTLRINSLNSVKDFCKVNLMHFNFSFEISI